MKRALAAAVVLVASTLPNALTVDSHRGSLAALQVDFTSRTTGWALAVAEDSGAGFLLRSDDGGRQWDDVTPAALRAARMGPFQLEAPFAPNGEDAWLPVARYYGRLDQSQVLYLFATADAGRHWHLAGRFPGSSVGSPFFLTKSTGFLETGASAAMGEEPVQVYTTSDGGGRWEEASASPPPGTVGGKSTRISSWCDKDGISFATPHVGFATGTCRGPAVLQRTDDAGATWEPVQLFASTNGDVATYPPVFSSPSVGALAVDNAPEFLFAATHDGGAHWALHRLPLGASRALSAFGACPCGGCLDVVTAKTWVVAAGREIYETTDGGASWASSRSSVPLGDMAVDFVNRDVGWAWEACGPGAWDSRSGLVYRTTDGGGTWTAYRLGGVP